ncbi:MAG: type 2 lantipeptide synthetase LanM [Candidatus Obscuribacterales bacterium]|nr:type 2 lantipeptide synthetase LanM [Candidatus Obscuribacterales bacterium]
MIKIQKSQDLILKEVKALFQDRMVGYCNRLAECYEDSANSGSALGVEGIAKVDFGHVLLPVLLDAVDEMRRNALYSSLTAKAQAGFELSLLQRLSAISTYSLFFEFSLVQAARRMFFSAATLEEAGTALYFEFVNKMYNGQFCEFLEKYSELNRCFVKIRDNWISSTEELLTRLTQDNQLIGNDLFDGCPLGELVNVTPSLSETRHKGRTVVFLEFSSGHSLFYKPRDCSSDVNYANLVDWFSARGAAGLRAVRTLNRSGYGWTLQAKKAACKSLDDVRRFYQNSGSLLCFLYVLRGTDNHFENVIASGDMPVLIDTETLMYPDADELMPGFDLPPEFDRNSVYSTMLIPPKPEVGTDAPVKRAPDASALGCAGLDSFELPLVLPVLALANTDSMYLDKKPGNELLLKQYSPQMNSQVIYNGKIQNFREFKEQILHGFSSMYMLLLKHKHELLASGSPLQAFKRQYVRAMFRPTRSYTCLLQLASRSEYMRDSDKRRRYLEDTLTAMVGDFADCLKPLINLEMDSLVDNVDVPYFTLPSAKSSPESWTRLKTSCFEGMLARIESISCEGLQKHLGEIAESCA